MGFVVGQSGTATDFSLDTSFSPTSSLSYHQCSILIHSSITDARYSLKALLRKTLRSTRILVDRMDFKPDPVCNTKLTLVKEPDDSIGTYLWRLSCVYFLIPLFLYLCFSVFLSLYCKR